MLLILLVHWVGVKRCALWTCVCSRHVDFSDLLLPRAHGLTPIAHDDFQRGEHSGPDFVVGVLLWASMQ